MANLHEKFIQFEKTISIGSVKRSALISSRRALESRIINHFAGHSKLMVPKFYIQGSFKMKTLVVDKNGTYDVDLGIYFLEKPQIEPYSLQKSVLKAVSEHTQSGVEHREKCIRVIYKGNFDIDLPVYYKTPKDKHPFLATKSGWLESDPKELCDWFNKKKDVNGQLVRIIKYFKAWANQRSRKMPNGISFTVWVTNHFKPNKRDDKAFLDTGKAIATSFGGFWIGDTEVINPATPHDNLLDLNFDQRTKFKDIFMGMLGQAEQAIETNKKETAMNIWQQLFGDKFV